MMSVGEVVERIAREAGGAQVEPVGIVALALGEWVRQGDVYLERVPDGVPRGARRRAQLVDGTSVGARHVAGTPAQVFEADRVGGEIVVVSAAGWTLRHPEHAHLALPAGTFRVVRQLDMQTRRAVED